MTDDKKKERIVRYESIEDIPDVSPSPELLAMSDDEAARRAAEDPDIGEFPPGFWDNAEDIDKEGIYIKLDRKILRYFRSKGKGYQSRINAVLSTYVDSRYNKSKSR